MEYNSVSFSLFSFCWMELHSNDVYIVLIFVSSGAGKVVNIRRLDEVINSINGWYMERGLFGLVCCNACTLHC